MQQWDQARPRPRNWRSISIRRDPLWLEPASWECLVFFSIPTGQQRTAERWLQRRMVPATASARRSGGGRMMCREAATGPSASRQLPFSRRSCGARRSGPRQLLAATVRRRCRVAYNDCFAGAGIRRLGASMSLPAAAIGQAARSCWAGRSQSRCPGPRRSAYRHAVFGSSRLDHRQSRPNCRRLVEEWVSAADHLLRHAAARIADADTDVAPCLNPCVSTAGWHGTSRCKAGRHRALRPWR